MLSKEKYRRKVATFQAETIKNNEKWKLVKAETGQGKFISPSLIIEGKSHHTSHEGIANALNRQYVRSIKKLINEMDSCQVNPGNGTGSPLGDPGPLRGPFY